MTLSIDIGSVESSQFCVSFSNIPNDMRSIILRNGPVELVRPFHRRTILFDSG